MTWNLRKGAIAVLALLTVIAGISVTVRWFVFPSPRLPADAIVVPRDAATLAVALQRVSPGGTIVLDPKQGPFAGDVSVNVPGITVCSLGKPAKVIGAGSAPAVTVLSDDVTLLDLEVSSAGIGLSITGARSRVERVSVQETPVAVRLSGARDGLLRTVNVVGGQIGLLVDSSNGISVQDLTVRGTTEVAVKVVGSRHNTFERLTIVDGVVGVSLEGGAENAIIGSRISDCRAAGVEMRVSSDNVLTNSVVKDVHVGVILDRASGVDLRGCTIERCESVGVSLQRAVQNRVWENRITASGESGILLSQSTENTVSNNTIRDCLDAGVRLEASDRNLLTANELIDNDTGIRVDQGGSCRILRNTLASRNVGLVIEGGTDCRVFDNRVTGGRLGIVLASADGNVVLRNAVHRASEAGLVLARDSTANSLAENRVSGCGAGIVIAGPLSRCDVRDNVASDNDVGVLLLQPGSTLRLEGNRLERNGVGLRQTASSDAPGLLLEFLDGVAKGGDASPPILLNNTFCHSRRFDIENETEFPLYAADNWWGCATASRDPSLARISSGVRLQESVWKGTVGIGAGTGDLEAVLGHVLKLALMDAGYHVVDLIGIDGIAHLREAVDEKDVDLILWATADADLAVSASPMVEIRIPAQEGWVVVVAGPIAEQLTERNLSALATMLGEAEAPLRWAIPLAIREDTLSALDDAYALDVRARAISWTETLEETETLLRFASADVAILERLEETATFSDFVALEDDRQALPVRDIIALLQPGFLDRYPGVSSVLSRLEPRLTSATLHDLISRVRLLHRDAESVAREFLKREGLLGE